MLTTSWDLNEKAILEVAFVNKFDSQVELDRYMTEFVDEVAGLIAEGDSTRMY